MLIVPLLVYRGDACWSLLHAVLWPWKHPTLVWDLGQMPLKIRGSLTPLVKIVTPQASYPGAAWAWGFLVLPANPAAAEPCVSRSLVGSSLS